MPPGLVRLPDGRLVPRGSKAERDYWKKTHRPDGTQKSAPPPASKSKPEKYGPNGQGDHSYDVPIPKGYKPPSKGKGKPKPPPIPILDPRAPWVAVPPPPAAPRPKGRSVVFKPQGKPPKHIPISGLHLSFPMWNEWLMTSSLGKPMNKDNRRTAEDYTRGYRAEQRAAKAERRAAVRALDPKARKFIGEKKLREFVETGKGFEPGMFDQISNALEGAGRAVGSYAERVAHDPRRVGRDVYDVADWWINEAPDKLLGKYEKGKGYQGGAAEAWDNMTTEEQLDAVLGKSLVNVLKGENLTPGNIGRAVAQAALVPVPFGKGLPSLATVLLRAGMSVEEAKVALQTGKGIREAMQAVKTPVLTRVARGKEIPRLVRPLREEDAATFDSWPPEAARRAYVVMAHAKKNRMPTLALEDEGGNLRAVVAYTVEDGDLMVSQLAGAGKGGGTAMMRELAQEASDLGLGVKLDAKDPAARAFYTKIGMHEDGKYGFRWSPEEAAAFAEPPKTIDDFKSLVGERPLTGKPSKGKVDDNLRALSRLYMDDVRAPYAEPKFYQRVLPARATRIAEEYAKMPDAAKGEGSAAYRKQVEDSYKAFKAETLQQGKALERAGYQARFMPVENGQVVDPYGGSPWEAMRALDRGEAAQVYPTNAGFGSAGEAGDHPLLEDTGLRWPQTVDGVETLQPVTFNDYFRWVHDMFGHKKEGVGFRADGEENAWRSHVAMYSDVAKPAMTSETRGQNSWVNFGPHAEANRAADQGATVYADQKAGIMPEWTWREGADDATPVDIDADSIADAIIAEGLKLPKGIPDKAALVEAINHYHRYTVAGAEIGGRDWYERAAAVVKETTDLANQHPMVLSGKRPPLTYAQVSQIFAILSATDNTVNNVGQVAKGLRGWIEHGDVFAGKYPTRASEEILAVLHGKGASWVDDSGELTWAGRKRTSFHMNIIENLDPEEYARLMKEREGLYVGEPVTVDMWIARIFGVEQPATGDYTSYERIVQEMAGQIGWHPKEVQAAGWVGVKDEGIEASFEEFAKTGKRPNYLLKAAGAADAFEYGFAKNFDQLELGIADVNPRAARAFNQLKSILGKGGELKENPPPGAGGFSLAPDLTINRSKTGYFVALAPYETRIPLDQMTAGHIEGYRDAHRAVLTRGHYIGGWYNHDDGMVYLDVSRKFRGREEALQFAREQGQLAIWDAKAMDEIPTGLTPEAADEIKAALRSDIEFQAQKGRRVVSERPEVAAKRDYHRYLDQLVQETGKGKRGVTAAQRAAMEEEMLKYANRYHDDPYFDEFWRLYTAANPSRSDDIPWGEAGQLTLGAPRAKPGVRTLRLGDKVQQLPTARSALTRNLIERPADWTSAKLASEESRAAAMIRKVLPTASAEARVAKAAGRQQIIEASRAHAKALNYIHDLPKANSPEDMAHFYWAQLPKAERNAQGLQRVRDAQAAELARIQTGEALTQLESEMAAVKAQLAQTKDLALLQELEDLKKLATDLPHVAEDLAASMAQLDKLIAKPPKLNEKVIEAVRALGYERRQILEEAGMLDPEYADAREGLLSSWLGLEPTGEEAYLGHRLGKVRGAQPSLTPASPGLGRPKPPPGARQRNKLVLARTGRLRASTHVAAEDWQAAQTYEAALQARDDLALMGKPFEGRLPDGYMIVNPKGRAIPAHWKKLPAFDELDDEEIRVAAKEIMDGFLADPEHADQLIAAAKEAGVNWDELRIVPERVVKRYYGQFTPAGGHTKIGKAYDAAIDFTAASIVFARVGYIPKNIAQNLIMAVPHQGPFLLVNAPRAVQALADPELRHLLHAEVGFSGATHEIGQELRFGSKLRGLPGGTANLVGKVADDPARFSAFIHEAAAAGVISKYSAVLSEKDRQALIRLFNDPTQRALLNDIRSRSVEAMADFSRLNPTQRRWARRFLIIPGWLWAGSRYPFHFAATHPIRSAGIAYVAAGAPGLEDIGGPDIPSVKELFSDRLPSFIEGIDLPDSFPVFGGKTFRTTSLSPVSTPYEIALALGGQDKDTAVSYANPLAKAIYNMAARRVEYPGGSYQTGYQEAILRNLERLLPNWTFVKQEISPSGDGRYPEDASRLGRFFRELGVVPIKIVSDDQKDEDEWVKEAERLSGGKLPEKVLQARRANQAYEAQRSAYEKEVGITEGGLTPQETLIVLVRTQAALHPEKQAQAAQLEAKAMSLSDDEAEAAISEGREKMGLTEYGRVQDKLAKARVEARTHTGMVNGGQH